MKLSELYRAKDGSLRLATLHVAPGVVVPATAENLALVSAAHKDFQTQPSAAKDWASYFAAALETQTNGIPDGYAAALAARRDTRVAGEWPKPPAAQRHSSADVPDGYAEALANRRKGA
jgi:hypothetical protein